MAASSSSSSSAIKEYDVFISFRGEDTRHNFISHLVSALSRSSIKAFIDYELKKGDEISLSLINAIHDSYGSLIIFSENYASSKWCLNELLEILKCRKQGYFVIPVFYNIDPSYVRKQTASYGEAFAKHEHDSKNNEKLELWKEALTEAANIAGWDSQSRTNRDEFELIQRIINDILQKMNHIYQPRESSFVGIEKYCEDIELLLQRTLLVGIWGIGGIGKTTIAKVVFDKLSSQYDSCCFFENVREEMERKGGIHIRDKLLSELLKDENLALKFALRRLNSKRVLIILDDVNSSMQLEYLQQLCNWLRADSNVIITTRDKHVLNGFRFCHEVFKVEGLSFEKSLHLFRLYAFNENYSEIEYEGITKKFVDYAKGNPLALKVLGSFLFSRSKEEWESALAKFKKSPNNDIRKVLRLSYDGLDHAEQQIFLDIACFLNGQRNEHVISFLESSGFHGHIGIRILQDKALVSILDGYVRMHALLQEMGQDTIRNESIKKPEKRSRLYDSDEVYDVLINKKGTDAIEGITLNLSQIKNLPLKIDTFKKMTNLRFFNFYYGFNGEPFFNFYSLDGKPSKVDLPGSIELPSEKLGYFRWDQYPLPSLPINFCAEKLVELRMRDSNVTKLWDGRQDIANLKEIDLWGCKLLTKLPDFSRASKLERVNLSFCSNLCHIHSSLLHLDTLVLLDATSCKKLTSLESDRHLKSLNTICVIGCSSLVKFSLSSENIDGLSFYGTGIETFPSSLERCRNLRWLDLQRSNLKHIPMKIISKLTFLTNLEMEGGQFDSLELPILFDALHHLEVLDLINCDNLFQLPHNISMLSSLNKLDLRGSNVESLPESIKHLSCLEFLDVSDGQRLRSLPELPPSIKSLIATNCSILETLIPSTALEYCDLKNCMKLNEQSFSCIRACVHYRAKLGERIRVCLPGDRALSWFSYRAMQNMISIELPPRSDLLGFICGLYFCYEAIPLSRFSLREQLCFGVYIDTKKYFTRGGAQYHVKEKQFNSDDVYLWFERMPDSFSANSETKANPLVSFKFFAERFDFKVLDHMIKGCAVWPIYASGLELELGYNSKRNHSELESSEHRGVEVGGLDHENQDE